MSKTFYITTPIYYVNDVPHIGHAYTTIAADVLARYRRLCGDDVFFLTGLDEHGQKVQQAAAKAGLEPNAYCDLLAPRFQELWKRLNIKNDAFIRTTDPQHQAYVKKTLETLSKKKLIEEGTYAGWYCTFDERFWTEKDVVEGLCPDCKRPIERLSESNYFFRMSEYQASLIKHIENNRHFPEFIRPDSRCNEVLGFLKKPLENLSISRPKFRLSWGIELPFNSDYVTYVWFDALANYISALEYLSPEGTKYWPTHDDRNHEVIHLVGKDILTTHAVYWSTMLMALGIELPTTIFAHGWWTVNGEKMSKSRGNVVDPNSIIDELNGPDPFRYFLLREVPFGQDGDFSHEAMIQRYNSELANDLGNLLSRTVTLIERYAAGTIPQPKTLTDHSPKVKIKEIATKLPNLVEQAFNSFEFNRAISEIWVLVKHTNVYIEQMAPWNLAKSPQQRDLLDTVLYTTTEALRWIAIYLWPFMPQTSEKVMHQLGLIVDFSKPLLAAPSWGGGNIIGAKVNRGDPLFPRIETTSGSLGFKGSLEPKLIKGETRLTEQPTNAASDSPTAAPSPQAVSSPAHFPPIQQITIEEFQKVQLKVAKVLSAERVPKSEKLLKLQVDLGGEQRQIVAGIGKKYEPETLVGRRIVIVANLKPAKLVGIESQGMVLAAGDKEVMGLVTILEEVDPGTKVK